jgi:hypothetical protein
MKLMRLGASPLMNANSYAPEGGTMKTAIRTGACWLTIGLAALLAGCSTVTSQVTVFHDWPANLTDKTYVFDKRPAQQNNLEYDSYANLMRGKLSQTGFTEVQSGKPVLFKIAFSYHTEPSDVQVDLPPRFHHGFYGGFYDPFYDPFWSWRLHARYYAPYRFYDPYFPGPYFGPYDPFWASEVEVRRWYRHELDILISDAQSGKQLFDVRSSTETLDHTINTQMPNLVESAFKEFPGPAGMTRTVKTDAVKAGQPQ